MLNSKQSSLQTCSRLLQKAFLYRLRTSPLQETDTAKMRTCAVHNQCTQVSQDTLNYETSPNHLLLVVKTHK